MLGAAFRLSQTRLESAEGGYAEGYYFNYDLLGPVLKYYPFAHYNFFVKAEVGMAVVLTKNRYLNSAGEQNFFHQFGIGTGAGIGAGYSLTPFRNKRTFIDLLASYGQSSTRV